MFLNKTPFFNKNEQSDKFFFHHDVITENTGGYMYEKHYHNLFEIYFITFGKCKYFIDNKSYALLPGDIIFIPPGVIHHTEYNNAIHSRMLINCPLRYIPSTVRPILPSIGHMYRNPKTLKQITDIFNSIANEYNNPDGYSEDAISSYTHILFLLIVRNLDNQLPTASSNECIEHAVEYVKSHFTSEITLSDISRMSHVSPEHFSRIFKKETGFKFTEYVNLLRMQKAESLIKECPSLSITEISAQCGFNDSNYFSLKFKKMYGIPPKKLQLKSK